MPSSEIPTRNPDFRLEELDGELVLYHPGRSDTLYLNETAAMVWQLCGDGRSKHQIIELLTGSFPASAATIEEDVETVLRELSEAGAIA